uniref:Uncharacterized protein n=1 Tax=Anguilla anguilla TaxID=7936 RepID=A0A0E9WQV1_ANGAN
MRCSYCNPRADHLDILQHGDGSKLKQSLRCVLVFCKKGTAGMMASSLENEIIGQIHLRQTT